MNKERLLNVAKACRESKHPFTMTRHVNSCGTPACAFGNYAAREDLQDAFQIDRDANFADPAHGVKLRDGARVAFDSAAVREHFDLSVEEVHELFGGCGCNDASSAMEAADYIECFVDEHK